jgi:hypothetical protein
VIAVCGSGVPVGKIKKQAMRQTLCRNFTDTAQSTESDALKSLQARLMAMNYNVETVNKQLNIQKLGSLLPVWELSSSKHRAMFTKQLTTTTQSQPSLSKKANNSSSSSSDVPEQSQAFYSNMTSRASAHQYRDDDKHSLCNEQFLNEDTNKAFKNRLSAAIALFLLADCVHGSLLAECLQPAVCARTHTDAEESSSYYDPDTLSLIEQLLALNVLYVLPARHSQIEPCVFDVYNDYDGMMVGADESLCADSKSNDNRINSSANDAIMDTRSSCSASRLARIQELVRGPYLWFSTVQVTPVSVPHAHSDLLVMTDFAQVSSVVGFDPVM